MLTEIKLYRKNSMGLGTWRIWYSDGILHYAHAITEGASEVHHFDQIETNLSGRSLEQQAELEMNSRISRMRDKGYKSSREEAMVGATNQMGLVNPMLAQSLSKVKVAFEHAHVQPKLDGHRALITNQGGDIFAYTRKGKPITTVQHILQDFAWLPEGKTVDGELYIHGMKLQGISSLIKRQQAGSLNLRYHWYDFVDPRPFDIRFSKIEQAAFAKPMKHVDVVDTFKVSDMGQVFKLFDHFRGLGYEGAMLRLSIAGYEDNKRALQLLKVKERESSEVEVLGATPSKDGWAVLRVRTVDPAGDAAKPKAGLEFDISAPGSVPEKQHVMDFIGNYIGKHLEIEYAMLTDDGIPFHAVAMRWKEAF